MSISANTGPIGALGFHYGDFIRIARNATLSPWFKVQRARRLTCFDKEQVCGVAWYLTCIDSNGKKHWCGANQIIKHSYQATESRKRWWSEQSGELYRSAKVCQNARKQL